MEKDRSRGERRDRTRRYALGARRVWHELQVRRFGFHDRPLGTFSKGKSIGCGCRRHPPGQPKLAGSMCHAGDSCYHPSVRERIRGRRLARAWLTAVRSGWELEGVEK